MTQATVLDHQVKIGISNLISQRLTAEGYPMRIIDCNNKLLD